MYIPPQSSSTSNEVGNDTRVWLWCMSVGGIAEPPKSLLHIPHDCMKLYSLKPRKWLLYLASVISGTDGTLRFLNGDEDFTEKEMDEDVSAGNHYVFCFDGEARLLDYLLRRTIHHDRSSSTSTRSCVVPIESLEDYYGGCPFSRVPLEFCEVCHLVPFTKGDDYLHRLLASRGESDDTMTIDDYQNLIVMNKHLHRYFDSLSVAFLKTPNKFLKTNEVPGGEDALPDSYRVTVHCFLESEEERVSLYHNAYSSMTEGCGSHNPPVGRTTIAKYLPKDILLDVTYASSVINKFGTPEAKEMLEKNAHDYYPDGFVKRGEDKERKTEKDNGSRVLVALNDFNLDEEFYQSCLDISIQLERNRSPVSIGNIVSDSSRLTDHYPAAYKDFFGMPSNPPCIYKTGQAWPEPVGPQAQRLIREARPVYGHPITDSWLKIGTDIYKFLDSRGIKWTSIDPVGFANAGEKTPFCQLLIWIGVKRETLVFDNAVAAANAIKDILSQAGFPNIEVAFRESEVTHSAGLKLLPFDPLVDPIPDFRKPFTPTLGLSIAPFKTPYYEGTGALYFRLSRDDDRVILLTAAHVARPPPVYANTGMSHRQASQPREEIVALGSMGYQNATNAMMATIGNLARSITVWKNAIARLGEFVEGEDARITRRREDYQREVDEAMNTINDLNKLHDEVTKRRTNPDQRIIGFVLHAEPIVVADGPNQLMRDWAMIQLYNEKIDWGSFLGNKVYIGDNLSPSDFGKLMFPQPEDQADYKYPDDGLLQAYGIVKDDEIRQPKHLDIHCEKALLVVKNGMATGTTVGRVNGLDSFTRIYTDYGIEHTSIKTAILPYDKQRGPFSAKGDSGAIILDRAGRIVALLTGGGGTPDETDITYGTPYWWLEQQIKTTFPSCHLYQVVN